jgi:rare lipoprotein A
MWVKRWRSEIDRGMMAVIVFDWFRRARITGLAGLGRLCMALAGVALLSACNINQISPKAEINNETKFSVKEYGVTSSPRITEAKQVRKGGGRYQVGKPYQIRGKWYTPVEDPSYAANGQASWYGPNFHGRLTANGEIYDQYSLSAAHPTLPLPSYARVTNVENGRSVIVRVNDRGPFAHNRIIDLSARAAELLAYKNKGVADVRVEYVGKAKMDGRDGRFLLASYRGPENDGASPGALLAMSETEAVDPIVTSGSGVDTVSLAALMPVPVPSPGYSKGGVAMNVARPASYRVAALAPTGYFPIDGDNSRLETAFAVLENDYDPGDELPIEAGEAEIRVAIFADHRSAADVASIAGEFGVSAITRLDAGRGNSIWQVSLMVGADVSGPVLAALRGRGFIEAEYLR